MSSLLVGRSYRRWRLSKGVASPTPYMAPSRDPFMGRTGTPFMGHRCDP